MPRPFTRNRVPVEVFGGTRMLTVPRGVGTSTFAPTAASAAYYGYGYGADFATYDTYKPSSGYSYGHRSQSYYY